MENKFTDNEIIKALECCCISECDECPYDEQTACVEIMKEGTLALINRQKAMIDGLIAGQETLQKALCDKNAEIERLNNEEKALLYTVEGVRKERRRLQTILVNFMDEIYEWGNKNNADTNNFAQIAILGVERDSAVRQIKSEARKEFAEKKKNPARQIRESDIRRIKKEATNTAIRYAIVLFLSVMRDTEGYGVKRLKRVYEAIEYLADSVTRGYVKISDLENALIDEADIHIKF